MSGTPSKSASSRVRGRGAVAHIVERLLIVTRDRRPAGWTPQTPQQQRDGITVNEAFPRSAAGPDDASFLNSAAKFCFPFDDKLELLSFDP